MYWNSGYLIMFNIRRHFRIFYIRLQKSFLPWHKKSLYFLCCKSDFEVPNYRASKFFWFSGFFPSAAYK